LPLTAQILGRLTSSENIEDNGVDCNNPKMQGGNVTRFLPLVLFSMIALAQDQTATAKLAPQRQVKNQTLISNDLPRARLVLDKDFRYLGGQVVNLYGNADAEQHMFVKPAGSGTAENFYWIQFEHFLPSNKLTYSYPFDRTADFGALQFIYDVKSFSDYDAMQAEDPRSDGAAIRKLLAEHGLAFPKKAARVRTFYFPTADRRTELMIIYGEALAESSKVPVAVDGVILDTASPGDAKILLKHAQKGLSIQKP
jgi:hypothetical protein